MYVGINTIQNALGNLPYICTRRESLLDIVYSCTLECRAAEVLGPICMFPFRGLEVQGKQKDSSCETEASSGAWEGNRNRNNTTDV
jgi:hypothetical protein